MSDPTRPDEDSLEQRMSKVEPAGASPPRPGPPEEKLELADRSPRAVQQRVAIYQEQLRARSAHPWARTLVIFALVLGVAGLAALLYFKPKFHLPTSDGVREATLLDQLGSGSGEGERQPILISSTPEGATIIIGGKTMGETPWAGENLWKGETSLVLQLPGYARWEGKLKGGQPQTLDIRLKR